jgi:hypothetical protein
MHYMCTDTGTQESHRSILHIGTLRLVCILMIFLMYYMYTHTYRSDFVTISSCWDSSCTDSTFLGNLAGMVSLVCVYVCVCICVLFL